MIVSAEGMAVSTASYFVEGVHAVGDDPLAQQRPHGVVEEDVALLVAQGVERSLGRRVRACPPPPARWVTFG